MCGGQEVQVAVGGGRGEDKLWKRVDGHQEGAMRSGNDVVSKGVEVRGKETRIQGDVGRGVEGVRVVNDCEREGGERGSQAQAGKGGGVLTSGMSVGALPLGHRNGLGRSPQAPWMWVPASLPKL